MACERKATIAIEIKLPCHRTLCYDKDMNCKGLEENLGLLEERREEAEVRVASHKRKVERYFDKMVKH